MNKEIVYERINEPKLFNNVPPVTLTDKTLEERKEKLLSIMAKEQYDALIIYADKEHGSNFEYFTGFIPRFEEGLIIIDKNDKAIIPVVQFQRMPPTILWNKLRQSKFLH